MPTTPRTAHIDALYRARASSLQKAVAREATGDRSTIEDACAFAWERLVSREDIDASNVQLTYAWLRTISIHEAWRLLAKVDTGRDQDAATTADHLRYHEVDQAERLDRRAETIEKVKTLTERERRYIGLHAAGFSYDEIADIEGVTFTAVNRHLARARRKLRHSS